MLSRALLFLLPVATLGGLAGGYTYDRCNMTYGPSSWPASFCQDQQSGTPIDLCGAVAFTGTAPTISVTNYNQLRTMNLNNDGSTLKVTVTDSTPPTLKVGNLAYIVKQSTNQSTQTWILAQMHLHWGRYNMTDEGSEHYMQGEAYAAEAHFVHYNSLYGSFNTAASSGASDALLVVGVFLEYGTTDDSATITAMAQNAATATVNGAAMSPQVNLSDVFDGTGDFYSYGGSLTTPNCNQVVTWIVMTKTKKVSWSTLMMIWKAPLYPNTGATAQKFATQASSTAYISLYGNYRPLQLLNGRTVYNTAGATAACTVASQPDFGCSAGLTSVADAKSYIQTVYAQTIFTFLGVTSMSDSDRAQMAFAITNNDIIQVPGAVFAYVLASGQTVLPLASSSQSAVSSITVTSWGTGSTTRAAITSYPSNSSGLTSMNVPYDSSYLYLFLFSIDRMNNAGTLTNTEAMTFQVLNSGITTALQVMAFDSTNPGGVDITTLNGGSVTNQGGDDWLIVLPHTSAVVGRVSISSASPSPAATEGGSSSSDDQHDGLFGLLALLILPFIACALCFWGWKQVKKPKAVVEEPMYAMPAPIESYPYGLPSSPLEYKPAFSMLPYSSSLPAYSASMPAYSAPMPAMPAVYPAPAAYPFMP